MKTALISVSDKTGIVEFAISLRKLGFRILSTGGTAKLLSKNNIKVTEVSKYTKSPEILDGRVKTLHPKIHAGLLAKRNDRKHMLTLKKLKISPIDLLVVNLYPFEETIKKKTSTFADAIENIDIGGPTMLRAAAKNFVASIVSPADYDLIINEYQKRHVLSLKTKQDLARKVFEHTARYDTMINVYLNKQFKLKFPNNYNMTYTDREELRYGENSHLQAAFYKEELEEACIANTTQLNGKKLSYNNINDTDAAIELIKEFKKPACVIIKHTNPCGAAVGKNTLDAYKKALASDPMSAYGGIVVFNRNLDYQTAKLLNKHFFEVIVAPQYNQKALQELMKKKNLRVLLLGKSLRQVPHMNFKKVVGGLLVQDRDIKKINAKNCKAVTKVKPTKTQMDDLIFAWNVAKHSTSNAIVYAKNCRSLGIGMGQTSRVDSSYIAAYRAKKFGHNLKGSVLASDGFFPFPDAVEIAAKAGVKAIIQPGGSMNDKKIIATADKYKIAMVFTGIRAFKH